MKRRVTEGVPEAAWRKATVVPGGKRAYPEESILCDSMMTSWLPAGRLSCVFASAESVRMLTETAVLTPKPLQGKGATMGVQVTESRVRVEMTYFGLALLKLAP